jgi:hypothetical protein
MLTFNKHYFILTISIFILEILIAVFARDNFVRPYVGDALVVVLIYCFVKSFFILPVFTVAIAVLIFSFVIEFLQYANILEIIGLDKSRIAKTLFGYSFEWTDLLAYTIGIFVVLVVEKYVHNEVMKTRIN